MEFGTGKELLERCREAQITIGDAMLARECALGDRTPEQAQEDMRQVVQVMRDAILRGQNNEEKSLSGLIGGEAKKLRTYAESGNSLLGDNVLKIVANGMAVMEVNSMMGRIVAAPTAGSCGVLPGALLSAAKRGEHSEDELIKALFTASAVGYLVTKNATVSGAEGGCQAEIGTATAMSAAALVELKGGTPEMALHAAAFAFKNILGLVCDPIAGLVECPCQKRNGLGILNAMLSADMALAGFESLIPFDEVVDAMYRVGRILSPDLKETAMGGLAATPTGKAIMKKVFG